MKVNGRYRFGAFLHWLKKHAPKVYNFIAPNKSLMGAVYQSLIKYYLDNKNNIVKEVKFKPKGSKEVVTPEIVRE